jgi:DNA-binding NarL/FixJ family response regulator
MVRVMVIDDHPMWRDAVARDLAEAGYEVVATASDGAQALRLTGAARPDVVVLDPQLPDMSGVDVTRGLRAADPDVRVLVLSASGERQDVLDAPKAGVAGYLLKSAMRAEFLDAVRRTADGDAVFTPGLAALVLGEFRRMAAAPAPGGHHGYVRRPGRGTRSFSGRRHRSGSGRCAGAGSAALVTRE